MTTLILVCQTSFMVPLDTPFYIETLPTPRSISEATV